MTKKISWATQASRIIKDAIPMFQWDSVECGSARKVVQKNGCTVLVVLQKSRLIVSVTGKYYAHIETKSLETIQAFLADTEFYTKDYQLNIPLPGLTN